MAERPVSRGWSRVCVWGSVVALAWVLAVRVLGPSDAWDQTQPRTMSYTTDIVLNGRWLLPRDRAGVGATKPPLYNWLAVPAVRWLGRTSELAHKTPSVIALCLCWLILLRAGPRLISTGDDLALGGLAAMIFLSSYTIFKIAYLARPDMLLTLWLLAGWVAATALLADASHGDDASAGRARKLALAFWLCVGLGALTKGPAVLPLLIYGVVGARLIRGRWRELRVFQWAWGLPLATLLVGGWLAAVWRIEPGHLSEQLWGQEIVARVTGTGPERDAAGPWALLTHLPYMAWYYLSRFEPWCVGSVLAMVILWRRERGTGQRRWRGLGRPGAALHGAALFVIIVIVFYTLSAGKRADYIAAAYGPGALLAAWWLLRSPMGARAPWLGPTCAGLMLAGLTLHNHLRPSSPHRGLGDAINAFAREADRCITADPAPMVFWATGDTHLQSLVGAHQVGGHRALADLCRAGRPFWLFAGQAVKPPMPVDRWLREDQGFVLELREMARTGEFPRTTSWPVEIVLYRVEPAGDPSNRP